MISKTIKIVSIVIALSILAIIGYSAVGPIPESVTLTKVKVQFKWIHAAQFAGFYAAKTEGIYRAKGIDPQFIENRPNLGIDPIATVVNKEVQFAVAEGLSVIKAIEVGAPIVAIGTNYQSSPVVVFSLSESGIERPEDLIGKTLKISPTTHSAYQLMMGKVGIDTRLVKEISKTSGATRGANYLEDIKDRTFDASEGYIINQPLRLREQGYDVNVIAVSDYGVKSYSDVIITHQDLWQSDPELVKNFVSATREGWVQALTEPKVVVEVIISQYRPSSNTGTTKGHELALLEASRSLVMPETADKILKMSDDVWQSMVSDLNVTVNPADIYLDL